jgi:hypothetical protein
MRAATLILTIVLPAFMALSAEALDLTKIDRSIRKEPRYESKQPRYCLIAFGAEAKTLVWLVVDGDVLYLDRNGNGDLTEPGERIEPRYALHDSPKRPDMKLACQFIVGRLNKKQWDGKPVLSCVPKVTCVIAEHSIPADDRKDGLAEVFRKCPFRIDIGTDQRDQDSTLAFASRPGDAPILHYDGPRHLAMHPYCGHLCRGEARWLSVQVITPGLGARMRVESADGMDKINPIAEIEFPSRRAGREPIRLVIELPGRG